MATKTDPKKTVSYSRGAITYRLWADEFGPTETKGAFRRAHMYAQAKAAARALKVNTRIEIDELARIMHAADPSAPAWGELGTIGTYRRRARQALGLDAPSKLIP